MSPRKRLYFSLLILEAKTPTGTLLILWTPPAGLVLSRCVSHLSSGAHPGAGARLWPLWAQLMATTQAWPKQQAHPASS